MVRSSLALVALAALSVGATAIPAKDDLTLMKRNYISSLENRSKLAKRQSVTSGGVLAWPAPTLEEQS